jgi:hypothetical protein
MAKTPLPPLSFKVATDAFKKAIDREFRFQRKSGEEIIKTQYRGVVRNVFKYTPPMSSKDPTFIAGRHAGQRAIQRDLKKMFRIIPDEVKKFFKTKKGLQFVLNVYGPNATPANLNAGVQFYLKLHKSNRGKNKRIVGKPKFPAFEATVNGVYKELLKYQGWVPSGWMAAARDARVAVPQWIAGKNAPGKVNKVTTMTEFKITMVNQIKHEDENRIQGNLMYAIKEQAENMNRSFAFNAKRKNS